jgi:hypothetical protein
MAPIRLLVGAGLVSLSLFLVVLLPARVAFAVLGLPPAAASGVSGTLWKGTVEHLAIGGVDLGPLRWDVLLSRLATAQLAADIEATLPDGFANGTVAVGIGSRIAISGLEAAAPLALLAPAAAPGGGQLAARFDTLKLRDGQVAAAVGTVKLADVVLPLAAAGRQLGAGTYEVTFDAPDVEPGQPLTGQLRDGGGPLEIAGTVTITPPRSYELEGTAKARPDAPAELRQALQMLGPATPDGGHALSLAGSF